MSSIFFVRHGQASFLADDYDNLSPLGRRQSQALGDFFVRQNQAFDEVYCGPRRRQIDTADEVGKCLQASSLGWPKPQVVEAFDEHQVDQLVVNHAAELGGANSKINDLNNAFRNAKTDRDKHRSFQLLFEAIADVWVRDGISTVETWNAFRQRVNDALTSIVTKPGRGRCIAVFTSVGPITVAVQRSIESTDQVALQTGWRISNAAVTKFVFSERRFTLDSFNCIGHLESSMQSYR